MLNPRNLSHLFQLRVEQSPNKTAYISFDQVTEHWVEHSWQEMADKVARCQKAMLDSGLTAGDRVAIMLPNGPDWIVFDQAALGLGMIVVPLYYKDRPENMAYCLADSEASLLVVHSSDQYQALVDTGFESAHLIGVVVLESTNGLSAGGFCQAFEQWQPDTGQPLHTLLAGQDQQRKLATIVYTSGTTGHPKGVMLSHGNILHNLVAAQQTTPLEESDRLLSFLPLSHMLERTCGYYVPMIAGAEVSFVRSSSAIAEDLLTQKPTVLISVPRVFERIKNATEAKLLEMGIIARTLFRLTVALGWKRFEQEQRRGEFPSLANVVYSWLHKRVARPVLDQLGGRLRFAVCGGAALHSEVARTFIGLGLPLIQGYGLTETSPILCANSLAENNPSSVGKVLPGYEIKVEKSGELCARGPNLMMGYWRREEESKKVIDAEGWFHTGDLAEIKDAYVYITGRLKEVIVLANGEKVPPHNLEQALEEDPLIEQALVVGEGRPFLAAILVLNVAAWHTLMMEMNLAPNDPARLQDRAVRDSIAERIKQRCESFPGYAKILQFHLSLEPWTIDNGLITPTLKLRRNKVAAHFADVIEQMYLGH